MPDRLVPAVAPAQPHAAGYNVRVGDVWYRTVAAPGVQIGIGSRDSLAQRSDDRGSIYENVLDIGNTWSRSDLSGGEGLDWFPRQLALETDQAALDAIRYWDSNNLDMTRPDVEGQQYSFRLAPAVSEWVEDHTDPKDMDASLDYLYVADGDTISWYASWDTGTPTGTNTPVALTDVVALVANPFDVVMALLSDGNIWAMRSNESAFSLAYNGGDATGVYWAHGRFVFTGTTANVSKLSALEDVSAVWTEVTIDTAYAPFNHVVESGPAIVAAVADGTVRSYTADLTDDTLPMAPRARMTVPEGEIPTLLGSNADILLIATQAATDELHNAAPVSRTRLYRAQVLSVQFDYVVGQLQLLREWATVGEDYAPTQNITNSRDGMLFAISELLHGTLVSAVWRFDLVTGGLSRLASYPYEAVHSITNFQSTYGFIETDGPTVQVEDNTYQSEGWVIFPNLTFGLNTDIAWIASVLECINLNDGGIQVELYRSDDPTAILDPDHASWVLERSLSTPSASGIEENMIGVESRTLALMVRMYAYDSDTGTPAVTHLGIRGIPIHRDLIMQIPINVSDHISAPNRRPYRLPHHGDALHTEMLRMLGRSYEVTVLDPPTDFFGIVDQIGEPIEYVAPRGSVGRYCILTLRGSYRETTSYSIAEDGMGLGLLGVALAGVGAD